MTSLNTHNTPGRHGRAGQPLIGFAEWFRPGDFERVEQVMEKLRTLGVTELRTAVSWADWYSSEGDGWYAWLLPHLAKQFHLLPCFLHTPPSLGLAPKFSSPPRNPKTYADFLDVMITRFGSLFEWMELWNRPDDPAEWDSRLDPHWDIFTEMIGGAAYWTHGRGKKTVLPVVWPDDPARGKGACWLRLMQERGILQYVDAVGVHGYPGASEDPWQGWPDTIGSVREELARAGSNAEVWITSTGSSTWRGDEGEQARALVEALDAPAERVYWRELKDRVMLAGESLHSDERHFHYGIMRANGSPKRLFSLWAGGGLPAVRESVRENLQPRAARRGGRHVLITGGAGFIGTNLAHRLLTEGQNVLIYDDLSRPGVERNVEFLRATHGERAQLVIADIRNRETLRPAVQGADSVFHFAAQVAVTTSLTNPRHDFDVNVGGTLNLLEELRALDRETPLLFTSTNKVYGGLQDLELETSCSRYVPLDKALRSGVDERRPLDFHSPYGCSKGAADQYVLDYARTFGLQAAVFRMSCIYGFHQMGNEDQGWVAHFLLRALQGEPIVLYGDGMQVRDLLFVNDLVDAFLLARGNIHSVSGQAFNIGGGLGNTVSLLELIDMITVLHGSRPPVRVKEWRCGDQRYYVSDTSKFKAATGWSPRVSAYEGVRRLYDWLRESRRTPAPDLVAASGGGHAVLPR